MRIGLISDVHGNLPAFKAVLKALLPRVERVFFLGDMAGYYPFVNECLEFWDEKKFTGIRGNHDEVLLGCLESGGVSGEDYRARYGSAVDRCQTALSEHARRIVTSWPVDLKVEIDSKTLRLYHGAPWDPLEGRVYPDFAEWDRFAAVDADIILIGHTHYPMVKRVGEKLIVNPGSVGQPRDKIKDASYAILDVAKGEATFHRVPYDASSVIRDAKDHDPGCAYLAEVLK